MSKVKAVLFPGGEWVYLKIYTGFVTSDAILASEVYTIVKKLYKERIIRSFFFIRYTDPDYHLRVRFLINNNKDIGRVIVVFYQRLQKAIKDSKVWKVQIDTYMREINRYHPKLINYAEEYFCIDSRRIIKLIQEFNVFKQDRLRWIIALYLIDDFLNNMKWSLLGKHRLLSELSDSFKKEFGFNEFNSKQFNAKYRANKDIIESIFNRKVREGEVLRLTEIVNMYSEEIQPLFNNIISIALKNKIDLRSFIVSCLHMTINRLFRTQNRLYELLIYEFMRRYYSSAIARNNVQS